jgi:uncharacterized membrane protein YbhN (UPF0104 family)
MIPTSIKVDRKQLGRILGSVLSLLLLIYLLSQQGWGEILAAIRSIPTANMIVVLVLLLISRTAISARWYTLLRVADDSVPFREAVRLTLAGLFAANFLPTTVGGDVVRAAGIARLSKNPVGSTASIVVDRLVGMFGMIMLLPLGISQLAAWLRSQTLLPAAMWPAVITLAVLQAPSGWRARIARVRRLLARFVESFQLWLRRPAVLLTSLGFTWIHMVCLFGEIWFLLDGMGEAPSLAIIGGLWSLSYFITLIPVSINGLGLREVSVTYIYSEIGGIPVQTALTLALILRALDMLVSLPGAILIPTLPGKQEPQQVVQ